MSKKLTKPDDTSEYDLSELSQALIKKDNRITDLEQRLSRIEKRTKSNERFARTFAGCLSTQVDVVRRSLREDAIVHDELTAAIKVYDKHKIRRWFSGFLGVFLWLGSVMAAAVVGAFIYWVFSGM